MEKTDPSRWPDSLLDRLRLVGDPLADAALAELAQTAGPRSGSMEGRLGPGSDLVAAVSRHAAAAPGACRELIGQAYAVPGWVSFPRMLAGYRVGLSRPVAGGLALLCGSLAESYSAAMAAKVLVRSGDLQRSTRRRIYETADFLHVLASSNGPQPGSHAHRVVLNLRLMHSRVRKGTQQRADWDPRWGVPVNQEDNGSTLLMFSLVYARGLQRL
ncbi:MAG TPA: oxygenase MpaB family protein, partial [Pseudomonadota bacterium]|nr:oxygenase MpaB family protein [Pseudomonadota bacterium]